MSAAAHVLRRRTSFLLQQRHKIHALSIPSLVTPLRARHQLPASAAGGRKYSATTTSKPPEESATSSSTSRALKYTTAGAAILLLSSAAWYTTRDDYSQVQYVGLPQLFHGRFQEETTPGQIDEKSLNVVQSSEVQEEVGVKEKVENDAGEAIPREHEQTDEGQPLHEVADDGSVPNEVVNTEEEHFKEASPEPPVGIEQIPAVTEHDSGPQETPEEGIPPLTEIYQEDSPPLKENEQEKTVPSEEIEVDGQNVLETVVDVVKDKVTAVKDYLFNEATDAVEVTDEVIDLGDDAIEVTDEVINIGDDATIEILTIREKLREENPEMFFSDSDTDDRDDTRREDSEQLEEDPEILEMLESGIREFVGGDRVPSRLSASYLVQRGHEDSVRRYSENEKREVHGFVGSGEIIREEHLTEDTKVAEEKSNLVGVDVLVGAIHTAKQLQAEVDGRTFQEQLHKIQEAHNLELKDFQAKIFAYAEGTDQLEKELKKEKEEAAAALKLQEERAEEKLQSELKWKEEEATREKERLQLLEKAQAAAFLTREKADHLEDIYSVQLQVDALRTAFYTRSEEARVSHTAHKLAMGAFALENAIERGEAVEKEADLLILSAGGPGVDPLVDAVVSSLPSEVLTKGTGTRAQLHHKFSRLKGSLRELALMPSGGGGVFAHFFARLAATLKIREQGSDRVGSEGIEVVIGRVERLLAEEKLVEAATVLETGARGTAAEGLAVEWAKQARNRAVIEQGLQVLRAHVIAVASGLS